MPDQSFLAFSLGETVNILSSRNESFASAIHYEKCGQPQVVVTFY